MRDIETGPGNDTAYECFDCGTIAYDESPPGTCSDCGGSMRNRRMPIE